MSVRSQDTSESRAQVWHAAQTAILKYVYLHCSGFGRRYCNHCVFKVLGLFQDVAATPRKYDACVISPISFMPASALAHIYLYFFQTKKNVTHLTLRRDAPEGHGKKKRICQRRSVVTTVVSLAKQLLANNETRLSMGGEIVWTIFQDFARIPHRSFCHIATRQKLRGSIFPQNQL